MRTKGTCPSWVLIDTLDYQHLDQHLLKISIDTRPTVGQHSIKIFIATQSSDGWCMAECQPARMYRSTLYGMSGKISQLLTNRVSITGVNGITGSEFGKSFLIWIEYGLKCPVLQMSVEQRCTNLCHNNSFVLAAPTHLNINNTCNFVDTII